jgi:tRNA(fMet)-specific endonuclease VapC
MKPSKTQRFAESLSLEELAEQQGVKPVGDLEEVAQLWPVDDDADELLRFILEGRRARREASRGRK